MPRKTRGGAVAEHEDTDTETVACGVVSSNADNFIKGPCTLGAFHYGAHSWAEPAQDTLLETETCSALAPRDGETAPEPCTLRPGHHGAHSWTWRDEGILAEPTEPARYKVDDQVLYQRTAYCVRKVTQHAWGHWLYELGEIAPPNVYVATVRAEQLRPATDEEAIAALQRTWNSTTDRAEPTADETSSESPAWPEEIDWQARALLAEKRLEEMENARADAEVEVIVLVGNVKTVQAKRSADGPVAVIQLEAPVSDAVTDLMWMVDQQDVRITFRPHVVQTRLPMDGPVVEMTIDEIEAAIDAATEIAEETPEPGAEEVPIVETPAEGGEAEAD